MTPAEPGSAAASDEQEGEEVESTSLDLPGRPQAIAALDTLQRYLLGVSHSDNLQSPDEPAVRGTVHRKNDALRNWLCTLFLHRNRDSKHGQGLLVLVYAYTCILCLMK